MSMRAAELVTADLTGPRPGVEESLGITGAKTVPGVVDVAAVDLVLDMGAGGFAKPTWKIGIGTATAIGAFSGTTSIALGPQGYTIAGSIGNTGETLNQEVARVLAVGYDVLFDAAGATAFAGKQIRGTIEYGSATLGNQYRAVADAETQTVTASVTTYKFNLNRPLLLPDSWALVVRALVADGTVFPANTNIWIRAIAYVKRKNGAEVPG